MRAWPAVRSEDGKVLEGGGTNELPMKNTQPLIPDITGEKCAKVIAQMLSSSSVENNETHLLL